MMPSKFFVCLILAIWVSAGKAQELPPVQNFSPNQYQAGNQNWAISQSRDKHLYIANNNGLLEYNGAFWKLYTSPNETTIRSVAVIGDLIYTGLHMDFGYWEKDKFGILNYTSLVDKQNLEVLDNEEFWQIVGIDQWVIFQSFNRIYIYDSLNETVNIIEADGVMNKIFVLDETIYFQEFNKGISKVENGVDSIFVDDPIIRSNQIIDLYYEEDNLVVLTKYNGFFSYDGGKLRQWGEDNDELSQFTIYSSTRTGDGNFAFGTIGNGLVHYSKDDGIINQIDQTRGLQNNTVLSVYEDVDGNIWAGLDNGISLLNITAPLNIYYDREGVLGTVYASAYVNETIYLGTNQGLYYKRVGDNGPFEIINDTKGQVWSLISIGDELFCGHHDGTFLIEGSNAKKVVNVPGTWAIKTFDAKSDQLIQGNYDGLYILTRSESGDWQRKNKIEGFNNSARAFEVIEDLILVNHEYKGVFSLTVDDDFTAVLQLELDTLLKWKNSSISKFRNEVLYGFQGGILKYDRVDGVFKKDSVLSQIYTDRNYISGRLIPTNEGDRLWAFTKENITMISSGQLTKSPEISTLPLTLETRQDVPGYENIASLGEEEGYLLGTSYGYITLNHKNFSIDEFEVSIGSVSNGINNDHSASGLLVDKSVFNEFDSDQNNFRIDFYTPKYYNYLNPVYQFQLVGIYDTWSEWAPRSGVFFENLPSGEYTFNVRARLGEKVSSNIASYKFEIAKPWYRTNAMIAIYLIGLIFLIIVIHFTYRRYYHAQRERLMEENRKALELTRLQNEKEIIRIKNEQLSQDVKKKNSELAASKLDMASKNEMLYKIKEQLARAQEGSGISPGIDTIDRGVNDDDSWELIKEAFESTDTEFFKSIKNWHPNLSPNDLKLCAYLRLNMSSKEIAQITNISPKSVEIKRYRLRKKLNLESSQNLIEYILSV